MKLGPITSALLVFLVLGPPVYVLAQGTATRSGKQTIGTDLSSLKVIPGGISTQMTLSEATRQIFINVKQAPYGAFGDGSHDDFAAIHAAEVAACAAGGGTVFFPAGTYATSSFIGQATSACSNIHYVGAGPGATVIKNTGSFPNNSALNVQGALGSNFAINAPTAGTPTVTTTTAGDAANFVAGQNIKISGALFSGDYGPTFLTTVTAVNAGTGVITLADNLPRADFTLVHVVTNMPRHVSIESLSISQASDVGWVFKTVRDVLVKNVYVDNGGSSCGELIELRGATVEDSECAHSLSIGSLTLNAVYDVVIRHNRFRATLFSNAADLENACERVTYDGNSISDPGGNGLDLGGASGGATIGHQHIVATNNIINGVGANDTGIRVGGGFYTVTGNVLACNSATNSNGISTGSLTDSTIQGNAVDGSCLTGVSVGGASNLRNMIGGNACGTGITTCLSWGSGSTAASTTQFFGDKVAIGATATPGNSGLTVKGRLIWLDPGFSLDLGNNARINTPNDGTGDTLITTVGGTGQSLRVSGKGTIFQSLTQANLGTPANGAVVYCSDCTIANPCAAAGTGALAKRLNGVWVCN